MIADVKQRVRLFRKSARHAKEGMDCPTILQVFVPPVGGRFRLPLSEHCRIFLSFEEVAHKPLITFD
jgi:hypothetical protein